MEPVLIKPPRKKDKIMKSTQMTMEQSKQQAYSNPRSCNHYQFRESRQNTTKAMLLLGCTDIDYDKSGWKGRK